MTQAIRKNSLSGISKALLAAGEGQSVDYKRTPDGISTEDLVAFANSKAGGDILIGAGEAVGIDGQQIGQVMGCDVGDSSLLAILNKAISCIPPVAVTAFIEGLSSKPIIRLHVPASESPPHCTPKGVYSVRDGSRNRPLHPGELLTIFLESEGRAFAERFESAAERITESMSVLEQSLEASIDSMSSDLGWADQKLGDTASDLATILSITTRTEDKARDIDDRVRSFLRQDNREDPVREKARSELLDRAVEQLRGNPELLKAAVAGAGISMTANGKAVVELDETELRAVLEEAVAKANEAVAEGD